MICAVTTPLESSYKEGLVQFYCSSLGQAMIEPINTINNALFFLSFLKTNFDYEILFSHS